MNNKQSQSIFITGANGGLGFETTKILARQGYGRIVMAAHTIEKAAAAKAALLSEIQPTSKIEFAGGFDMTNIEAIELAVKALPANQPFDIVFLQAGGVIFGKDYQYVNWGEKQVEKTVFQNVIGGYITLVNLEKRGLIAPNARIIFAGGEGARGIPGMIEKPVFETVEAWEAYLYGQGEQKKYNEMNAIGVSKLASAMLSQQLAKLNDGRSYVWFSPGLTHGTKGLSGLSSPIKRFMMEKVAFGISGLLGLSQSPQKGAQKYADSLAGKYGKNGEVLGAPAGKVLGTITNQIPMNSTLSNETIQQSFWDFLQKQYEPYAQVTA